MSAPCRGPPITGWANSDDTDTEFVQCLTESAIAIEKSFPGGDQTTLFTYEFDDNRSELLDRDRS